MNVTLYNNSCFLLSSENTRILIDPYVSRKQLQEIPMDYVLISHAHIDHMMHAQTIRKPIIAPKGLQFKKDDKRIKPSMQIGDVRISTVKALHPRWFQRGLLYNAIQSIASIHRFVMCKENYGFIFENGMDVIYYSGDTLFSRKIFEYVKQTYRPTLCLISFETFQIPGMKLLSHIRKCSEIKTIMNCPIIPIHQTRAWYDKHLSSYIEELTNVTYERHLN